MVKTEQLPHAGGFILSEAPGTLSREVATIRAGENLKAGTVIAELQDGNWAQFDPSGSGDADVAAGVLFADVDASDGLKDGVVVRRLAEVKAEDLIWVDGITAQQKADALAELAGNYVIARSGPATYQLGPSS